MTDPTFSTPTAGQKPRGTSLIFFDLQHRILLYRRDNNPTIRYPDCWDLPGGAVEANETPDQAIARELLEELEYNRMTPEFFRTYEFEDRTEHVFCIADALNLSCTPLHEGQYLKWFNKNEISEMEPALIAFNFKSIILDFYEDYLAR